MYDGLKNHVEIRINQNEPLRYIVKFDVSYRSVIPFDDQEYQDRDPSLEFETWLGVKELGIRNLAYDMAHDLGVDLDKYDLVRNIPVKDLFDMIGRYRSGALCDAFGRSLYPDSTSFKEEESRGLKKVDDTGVDNE